MFERFTERARQIVVHAQDHARAHGREIEPRDILAGVIMEGDGLAFRVLTDTLDVSIDATLADEGMGKSVDVPDQPTGQVPFTSEGKAVLQRALREALGLGHNWIGTEHILLALTCGDHREPLEILGRVIPPAEPDSQLPPQAVQAIVRNEIIRALASTSPGRRESFGEVVVETASLTPEQLGRLNRAFEVLKDLVANEFQASMTVYGSPMEDVRVNVLYETFEMQTAEALFELGKTHGFAVEVSKQFGLTFRPR